MRKNRSDSVDSAVRAMISAAAPPIEPPSHVRLRRKDKAFWAAILASRARDEWTPADLVVAAQLARTQHDYENESRLLESEGSVVLNHRGTLVANARCAVLRDLAGREMAMMRALRMGGRVAGDSREEAGRRKIERESRALRDELAEDDLLA